jgi:LEA14-like dessication related protein
VKRSLLLLLTACHFTRAPVVAPDPELTFLGHAVEPGLCTTVVALSFSVSNPRAQTLQMREWSAEVTRDGQALPPQSAAFGVAIAPQGEAKITLPVKVQRACAGTSGFTSPHASESIQVSGKMVGNAGSEIAFEFEDKLDLTTPKMPELSIDTTAQHYDEGRVEVVFNIKLRNPNPFPLPIDSFAYRLLVGGNEAASGEAWAGESAEAKSVVSFEVPVRIEPQDRSALAALLRKPSFRYDLDAHLTTGGSDYPMRTLGEVQF